MNIRSKYRLTDDVTFYTLASQKIQTLLSEDKSVDLCGPSVPTLSPDYLITWESSTAHTLAIKHVWYLGFKSKLITSVRLELNHTKYLYISIFCFFKPAYTLLPLFSPLTNHLTYYKLPHTQSRSFYIYSFLLAVRKKKILIISERWILHLTMMAHMQPVVYAHQPQH